jgi:hypothetical protein
VLAEVGLRPARFEPAQLTGFAISIRPLANLHVAADGCTFGMLSELTHPELARLYEHAEHVLGGKYWPEAVLVQLRSGAFEPALCYISHTLQPKAAESAYVERIAAPAQRFGFPDWYLRHLLSFKG